MNEKQYYEGLLDIINKQYNGDATWNDVVDYRESHGVKTSYDYAQRGSAILMELLILCRRDSCDFYKIPVEGTEIIVAAQGTYGADFLSGF